MEFNLRQPGNKVCRGKHSTCTKHSTYYCTEHSSYVRTSCNYILGYFVGDVLFSWKSQQQSQEKKILK